MIFCLLIILFQMKLRVFHLELLPASVDLIWGQISFSLTPKYTLSQRELIKRRIQAQGTGSLFSNQLNKAYWAADSSFTEYNLSVQRFPLFIQRVLKRIVNLYI